jgi:type VI secretion system ImpB/VipA family protein
MPGRLQFEFSSQPLGARPRAASSAMRLLVMGDFSGRPAADRPPLAGRATHKLDADSFDAVLKRIAPVLRVGNDEIEFSELEHFHPDSLYTRVPVFAALRQMRQRLSDPAQFAHAAAELGVNATPAAALPAAAGGGDLLAGLLGGRPAGAAAALAPAAPATGVDAFSAVSSRRM